MQLLLFLSSAMILAVLTFVVTDIARGCRARKRLREMKRIADWKRDCQRVSAVVLALAMSSCGDMTPAERAAWTQFGLESAKIIRDKKFGPEKPVKAEAVK